MFIDVKLRSTPANESVTPDQLYVPQGVNATDMAARRKLLTKILVPSLIGAVIVFICLVATVLMGCAKLHHRRTAANR